MTLTLAQMHALLADNTAGDISAEDARDVVESLSMWPGPNLILSRGETLIANSNQWYPFYGWPRGGGTSISTVADVIRYVGPFFVTSEIDVDNLGFATVTSGAGYNFRLALYEGSSTTSLPNTLLGETASTASIGNTNHTLAITPVTLTAGRAYWGAVNFSASQGTFRTYDAAATTAPATGGLDALAGSGGAPTANELQKLTQSFAYAAFPATATPVSEDLTTVPMPLMYFQVV